MTDASLLWKQNGSPKVNVLQMFAYISFRHPNLLPLFSLSKHSFVMTYHNFGWFRSTNSDSNQGMLNPLNLLMTLRFLPNYSYKYHKCELLKLCSPISCLCWCMKATLLARLLPTSPQALGGSPNHTNSSLGIMIPNTFQYRKYKENICVFPRMGVPPKHPSHDQELTSIEPMTISCEFHMNQIGTHKKKLYQVMGVPPNHLIFGSMKWLPSSIQGLSGYPHDYGNTSACVHAPRSLLCSGGGML